MLNPIKYLILTIGFLATSLFTYAQIDENSKFIHRVYLVGDAGSLDDFENKTNIVITAVAEKLKKEKEETSLVFLGDNIYPKGLPKKKSKDREKSEDILINQLELSQLFPGKTIFIPGNHDWKHSKKGGLKAIRRQEKFVHNYYAKSNKVKFFPKHGCGDPKVLQISKDLAYVFIDSQWWLQNWEEEKDINHGCEIKSKADFIQSLEEIFIKYRNDQIVLFLHHPLKSQGNHGGNFSLGQHLFPLREFNEKLWIPLPVIGSFYPVSRKLQGSLQDISHPLNEELMDHLVLMAKKNNNHIIYASGHEHSLQHFDEGKLQYVVSGSGTETTFIKKQGSAKYAEAKRGFAKLDFFENGSIQLEFYTVDENANSFLDYSQQIRSPNEGTSKEISKVYPEIIAKDTVVAADLSKKASRLKRFFMGEQYRDLWTTSIPVKMLNINQELGGLTALKRGGGMSSNSLRLESNENKQYVLRSVNKVFTRGLPEQFRNLKLINILKDQNSAYHPYSSWIVSRLAEEVNVFHTKPEFVFLKRQEGLKSFNPYFPESIYLFEQRPNGDWSDTKLFGGSDQIISYSELLENLRTKKHHFVDQEWVLRSRLFDLLIHDWDRHDDQWRWAGFKEGKNTIYRPIPRDRDLAFYKFKGLIPSFISKFVITKYKAMGNDVTDVKSLSFNGKYFDRYFLNELEWEQWEQIVEEMQLALTDEVIDASSRDLPNEIRGLSDKELNSKLKARRDNLKKIARRFYELINPEVEITGSDHKDHFEIMYLPKGEIEIKQYVIDKKHGDLLKYHRTFDPSTTKEIRVYGLRGKDHFEINGNESSKIKLRIIGGEDKDYVLQSNQKNLVRIYDEPKGMNFEGDKIKDLRSTELDINEYDRYGFSYDVPLFLPSFHYNRDGFWLGGAYTRINHEWRAKPYRSKNTFKLMMAPITQGAYRADYAGHFPNAIGKIDFEPILALDFPVNRNFFGFGNESQNTSSDRDFNWIRMNDIEAKAFVTLKHNKHLSIKGGPYFLTYDIYRPDSEEPRFLTEFAEQTQFDPFKRNYFLGAQTTMDISFVDRKDKPTNGFNFQGHISYLNEVNSGIDLFTIGGKWACYFPLLNKPEITLANNLGYTFTKGSFGEELFFLFPDLGNKSGLRGFRNNRFIGETAFYENVDLRIKVLEFNNSILPLDIGLIGGFDIGRVWLKGEASSQWHHSKTIGVWFDFLGLAILQPYYSFTEEGNTLSILTRFNF